MVRCSCNGRFQRVALGEERLEFRERVELRFGPHHARRGEQTLRKGVGGIASNPVFGGTIEGRDDLTVGGCQARCAVGRSNIHQGRRMLSIRLGASQRQGEPQQHAGCCLHTHHYNKLKL